MNCKLQYYDSTTECFGAKQAYIAFRSGFYFCRIKLIIGRLICFCWFALCFWEITYPKSQFSKCHLLDWIVWRWILTQCKLKQLLLAASTAPFLGSYALHTDPIVRGNLICQCVSVSLWGREDTWQISKSIKIVWQVDWVLVIPSCFIDHYCFHRVVVVVYL